MEAMPRVQRAPNAIERSCHEETERLLRNAYCRYDRSRSFRLFVRDDKGQAESVSRLIRDCITGSDLGIAHHSQERRRAIPSSRATNGPARTTIPVPFATHGVGSHCLLPRSHCHSHHSRACHYWRTGHPTAAAVTQMRQIISSPPATR